MWLRKPRSFDFWSARGPQGIVDEVRRRGVAIVRSAFAVHRLNTIASELEQGIAPNESLLFNHIHIAIANEVIGAGWAPSTKSYVNHLPVMGWWIPLNYVDDDIIFELGDAMILTSWNRPWAEDRIAHTEPSLDLRFEGRGAKPKRFLFWRR